MSTSNFSSSSSVNELVLRSIWPPCEPKMVMTPWSSSAFEPEQAASVRASAATEAAATTARRRRLSDSEGLNTCVPFGGTGGSPGGSGRSCRPCRPCDLRRCGGASPLDGTHEEPLVEVPGDEGVDEHHRHRGDDDERVLHEV